MNPGIQVRCFTGIKGLNDLAPAWQGLFQTCQNPCFYNDWRWHQAVQQHLTPCNIRYFAVYEGETLIGIVPLNRYTRRRFGLPIVYLTFPTHPVIDLADIVLRRDKFHIDLLDVVLRYINRQRLFRWDALDLSRFPSRSSTYALIGKHAVTAHRSAFVERGVDGSLLTPLSKKQIKNTRRHLNKAKRQYGDVTFTRTRSVQDIGAAYDLFLEVEASSWKGADGTGTAIRLQPRARAFFQAVLEQFSSTGDAQVNVLYVNGKPAAAQLALRMQDRLALLKIGYDEALKDIGPGGAALLSCLEQESDSTRELSLVTDPPWAQRWHFQTEQIWSYNRFNKTFYAHVLRGARSVYIIVKRLLRR